ncbi:hypothetical protein RZS08_05300, partial [Arthrospira platensis SPKY1]|nr:hypothetical protein [Arthrospira platensis SPKY1]
EDKNLTITRVCNIHAVTTRNMVPFANKEGFTVVRASRSKSGTINYWLQKKSEQPEQDLATMAQFFQPGEIIYKFIE